MIKNVRTFINTAVLTLGAQTMLTSCSNDDNSVVPDVDTPVVINCMKPDYLKAGDKVALLSPSYFVPAEQVEATADLLMQWAGKSE